MSLPIKRCAPGGCEYLMSDDVGFHECGEPAAFRSGNGLLYCRMHAEIVRDDCRRKRVPITLKPILPSPSPQP